MKKTSESLGFTLIEMVIVIILIGLLAAAVVPIAFSGLRAYTDIQGDVLVLDRARYAVERIAREVREVKYSASGFAFSTPVSACGNSVGFVRTFFDASGAESADTTVTVGNTGTAVTLAYSLPAGVGAQILTDQLGDAGNLVICYFQANGSSSASSVLDVRSVQISLTLRHNGNDYTQQTRVELKRYAES